MKQSIKYLTLRFRQLFRFIKAIGGMNLILVTPILFILLLGLLEMLSRQINQKEIGIVILLIIVIIHFYRKDKTFLDLLEIPKFQLYLIEYNCFLLFITIPFLLLGDYVNPIITHLGSIIIAALPQSIGKAYKRTYLNFNFISKVHFEWKAKLRVYYIPFIIAYLIATILSKFIPAVLLFSLFVASWCASFYEEFETKEIVENIENRYGVLKVKSIGALLYFHSILLPLYLLFIYFHLQYWYLLAFLILANSLIILFSIYYKYQHYAPLRKKIQSQLPLGLYTLSCVIPVFLPLAIIVLIYQYKKAKSKIEQYVHA